MNWRSFVEMNPPMRNKRNLYVYNNVISLIVNSFALSLVSFYLIIMLFRLSGYWIMSGASDCR